jgi:transcriptional regulator with XRE-family HTH domain
MMDDASIMAENGPGADLNQRIGRRVRGLRAARGLSLEALAATSGVSRSMISLIERGESSPTAVVLEKLGAGLRVTLASLFDDPAAAPEPVLRRRDQPVWQDPGSGYRRRNVSPAGVASPIRIVEVEFPAGARVAYESPGSRPVAHQQVWVLEGRIDVTWGQTVHRLDAGDCLAMRLDAPMVFHNPARRSAHYVVVLAGGGP